MHFRKVSSKIINSKLLSFKINLNGKLSYLDWCFFIAKGQSVSSWLLTRSGLRYANKRCFSFLLCSLHSRLPENYLFPLMP